jgi:hypothetical protein
MRNQRARLRRGPQRGAERGRLVGSVLLALVLCLAVAARADRTPLKPGFNLFSPAQDVELGKKFSHDVEHQLPMLNDARVDDYLNQLGHRLDAHVPPGTPNYPFQYRCVNDLAINAFALPGGFVYINRGVIEAADNEAQLAGVMAHETSHVVLRHSTNQVSKQSAWQVPLSLLGGALGNNSIVSALAQAGIQNGMGLLFLKMSRTDESQADIMGTQILYDSGYDPRAMAQFFEKLQGETKGNQPVQFFSDHPNPDHRIDRVDQEIEKLGGPPAGYKTDSNEFELIKRYLRSLPPPPKGKSGNPRNGAGQGGEHGRPDLPSRGLQTYQRGPLSLQYPSNWRSYEQNGELTLAPDRGIVDDNRGNSALAYGAILNLFEPQKNSSGSISLEAATDQLVSSVAKSNPHMNVVRPRARMRLDGKPALSTYLENDSPIGGRESDWLVTASCSDSIFYVLVVAPKGEYDSYEHAFQALISSVRYSCQ